MKNTFKLKNVLAIAAVSATAFFTTQSMSNAAESVSAKVAPAWELPNVDGQTVRSADFKDKVVVVVFWATWCPPCRAEIPGFIELEKKYSAKGLTIVGVSVDQASTSVVKSFAQKQGINYPVLVADEKIQTAFGGISALPTTFIIDRKGNIAKQHVGFAKREELEAEIKPLLAP